VVVRNRPERGSRRWNVHSPFGETVRSSGSARSESASASLIGDIAAGLAERRDFVGVARKPAVAEVLFGDNDPSGRLPVTILKSADDLPQTFNHLVYLHPIDDGEHPDPHDPLYPFGHGPSYTDFETDGLSATYDGDADAVTVSVDVSNVGEREGTETVQVYARQRTASRVRPVRSLVGFDRATLAPVETAAVTVRVPTRELGFYKPREGHVVESGTYRIDVNGASTTVNLSER